MFLLYGDPGIPDPIDLNIESNSFILGSETDSFRSSDSAAFRRSFAANDLAMASESELILPVGSLMRG